MTKAVARGAKAELYNEAGIEPQSLFFGLSSCGNYVACESDAPSIALFWGHKSITFYNVFEIIKRWMPNVNKADLVKIIFTRTNGLSAYVSFDVAKKYYQQVRFVLKRLGLAALDLFKYWSPIHGNDLARDYFGLFTTVITSDFCGLRTNKMRSLNPLCCPVIKTQNIACCLFSSYIVRFVYKSGLLHDDHLRNASIVIMRKKNLLYIPLIDKTFIFGAPTSEDNGLLDSNGIPSYSILTGRLETSEPGLLLPMHMCRFALEGKYTGMSIDTTPSKAGSFKRGQFGPEIQIHSINDVKPKQVDSTIEVPFFLNVLYGLYGVTSINVFCNEGKKRRATKFTCKFEIAPIDSQFN
jgi:hypothetical protein